MTAEHARPLVAYVCVAALAALLLLAQGMTVPRPVPVVHGVIGGAGSLDLDLDLRLGVDVVLAPLQGGDETTAVGKAVPQRVSERRAVLRPASSAPPRTRAAAPVRPHRSGAAPSGAAKPGPRVQAKPATASGAPRASATGKGRVKGGHARTGPSGGHARTSLRSSPRDVRGAQRGLVRGKGHGSSGRR